MKGKRVKRSRRIYEALDLPAEADLVTPRISMTGNDALLLENSMEAFTCTDKLVRVNTVLGILRIEGERLELREFTEGRAFVSGRIRLLAFEAAEGI